MWLLPTYNRPEKCKAVLDQIIEVGCSTPGTVIINGYNGLAQYKKMALPEGWKMLFMPMNLGLCGAMQFLFMNYPNEPFYGLFGDDEYVHSPGWDATLVKAAGNYCISHGNDGWQSSERIHSYAVFGGDLVRAVGWWAPPHLWHWYIEDVWENIARDFSLRRWCQEVKTENKHYLAGKAEKDKTYMAAELRAKEDQQLYKIWLENDYPRIKERLGKLLATAA